MPQILNSGYTFGSTEQVTSTKLGQLVELATFSPTAIVSGGGLEISSGSLQVANASITPTKLSSGAPSWTSSEVNIGQSLTVQGTITSGGSISTSNNISANGTLLVNGDSTFVGKLVQSGSTGRTVRLQTGSTSPNTISFGWSSGDLLVTVDGTEYKVTLTPV